MKVITVLLLSTLLTGCFWQSVPAVQIDIANKWCEDKGGIGVIKSRFNGSYAIFCQEWKSSDLITSSDITQELFKQQQMEETK